MLGQLHVRGLKASACADDLNVTLAGAALLPLLDETLRVVANAAGLMLNLVKCYIIPLAAAFSTALHNHISARIRALAPSWRSAHIVSSATLLGIVLGPCVKDSEIWDTPLKKAAAVARTIFASNLSPALTGFCSDCGLPPAYNTSWLNKALRTPANSVGYAMVPIAKTVLGLSPPTSAISCGAALLRVAWTTLPEASLLAARLRRRVRLAQPLQALVDNHAAPSLWTATVSSHLLADLRAGRAPHLRGSGLLHTAVIKTVSDAAAGRIEFPMGHTQRDAALTPRRAALVAIERRLGHSALAAPARPADVGNLV